MSYAIKQSIKNCMPASLIELLYFLKFHKKKLPNTLIYKNILKNRQGIEIGGPSMVFKSLLPLYSVISDLDGVNFSNETLWEGSITEGTHFNYYWNKKGRQFIAEGTDLVNINCNTYDFLLSANCLEHIANPIKAVKEWIRVIKPNGYLLLVLPRKEMGFDHKRPITSFKHILQDYSNDTTEHDLTHLNEILELHDLSRDRNAGNYERFKSRSLENFKYRGLHHHVFDMPLIEAIFKQCNITLVQADEAKKNYYALGQIKK